MPPSARAPAACATIGIGAGPECDFQALVLYDMLGLYPGGTGRYVKDFMAMAGSIKGAVRAYVRAGRQASFPGPEHCYRGTRGTPRR